MALAVWLFKVNPTGRNLFFRYYRKDILTMNDREIRISQLGTRMNDYGAANSASFPAGSRGRQKFDALAALVLEIDQHGASQAATTGAAQGSTAAKREARNSIRRQMKAIRDVAVALESEQPGISNNFRMPTTNGDEALVNSARAFVTAATPLKPLFISNELPSTFLEDLTAAVTSFEQSITSYNQQRAGRAAATASLKQALSGVLRLRRELDPIVRNKFRGDTAKLAAWESASHMERDPQRAPTPASTPQP